MAFQRFHIQIGRLMAACLAVSGLMASEHHGTVKSGGLAVPGATVTAIQGDKKLVTTTDDDGNYSFADLPDGIWTFQIEMLGFAKISKEVGIDAQAPTPQWQLKLLSPSEMTAALAPPPPAPAAAPAGAPSTATATPAPAAGSNPATTPANPGSAAKPPAATASANASGGSAGGRGGRGGNNGTNNGRPSIRNSQAQAGFTRVDVNASGDTSGLQSDNMESVSSDLTQSANDALVLGGSMSSAAGMPQSNDWFGGRGGMDGFGPGFGPGMGGPGGLGDNGQGGDLAGGRGGRGGGGPGGGGPGGGGPGAMGMRGGGGGPGGFGGGGFGGRGGPGGRGGRGGPGGRNPNAFGNGRRDARMRYNGNVAFILDNSALDAQQYSLTGQSTPKPATANARMTAVFGGPLKIPHLLSGQKTTFNINYQFTRARSGSTVTTLVPTAAERGGDFSQALTAAGVSPTIYDPLSGSPFPGNVIPQDRISTQAAGLLAFYPLPNFSGVGTNNARYNYQTPIVAINNQDNVNTRVNHTINTKNQIFGNFSYQRADGTTPNVFGFVSSNHQSAYNTGANWTYHFTTRLINTLAINFSRNTQSLSPYFANRENVSGQLGIGGNDQNPNYWGPPTLSFLNGFQALSDGNTTLNRAQTTALSETVRWFRGTHNFTFGGDIRRVQNNPINESNARGTFTFNGNVTAGPGGVGGYDLADLLLGLPDASNIAYGNADKYFRNGWFDAYMTDDWRLTTQLSLNLGLRWDYQLPTTELYGRIVNMQIPEGFGTASTVCAGTFTGCTPASQVGLPASLLRGDPHEFQPRIGYAWKPFPKKTTVVRGGFGIYFNTSVFQSLITQMAQQSPLSYSLIDSISQGPLTLANGFPQFNLTPISTFAVDPNFRIGYVESWQTAVQQNLFWSLVATVTYSGAKGTHQPQTIIPNSAPPGAKYACAPGLTCPTNFYYLTPGGNTISNNLWLQLQRRFRSGFSGNVLYAHANSIDNGAAAGGRGQGSSTAAQNWQDLDAERARTSGIRANTLNVQMQYSTGMGARGGALVKGLKGKLLRDWTVTTNLSVASGAPETPTTLKTLGGTGITGPLRAEYLGGPLYVDGMFNQAAFQTPVGIFGDAGRNILTGPTLFSLNASAGRIFRVGERRSFDLRFDSTNILNHVTFGSWNSTVGSAQFGLPQSPSAMRRITATLRFRF